VKAGLAATPEEYRCGILIASCSSSCSERRNPCCVESSCERSDGTGVPSLRKTGVPSVLEGNSLLNPLLFAPRLPLVRYPHGLKWLSVEKENSLLFPVLEQNLRNLGRIRRFLPQSRKSPCKFPCSGCGKSKKTAPQVGLEPTTLRDLESGGPPPVPQGIQVADAAK
jgi:hypothetical protein